MAHEFQFKFHPVEWYPSHVEDVRSAIARLPSFARQVSSRELWLKANDSLGQWDYDLRIFLEIDRVLVEVSSFGTAYFADLHDLIVSLSRVVKVELVDEDGEAVRWW